ncbi:hypothetical protein AB0O76_40620 [Streptomyces sp. NPDC086554]|uniref:hypothetical protein n=1 Tax=Streptomyces sp. NPDC086554 TaxID=3154864 RepID=UPI003434F422
MDLWRGRLSLRRVHVLLQALYKKMGESTLLSAVDETATWSETNHILARISDGLELSNYLFIKANSSDEDDDFEPPKPLPRPGQVAEEPAPSVALASGAEVADFFTNFGKF